MAIVRWPCATGHQNGGVLEYFPNFCIKIKITMFDRLAAMCLGC